MKPTIQIEIPARADAEHRRCLVGGEPMIFHCHHYNTFLQRSIQDATYLDSRPFLVGAAAEVAWGQLTNIFREKSVTDRAARADLASELYRWAGFGTFDLASVPEAGGVVRTDSSHYGMAWKAKFGRSASPVGFFASGWLAGAVAAIHGKPNGHYRVEQTKCSSTSDSDANEFRLEPGEANYSLFETVGAGRLSKHALRPVPPSPVDYEGIYNALTGMEIVGDSQGNIPAFGVYLTRHYANYYNRISFELLRQTREMLGDHGREVAEPLLIEAGHVCAFNTFGGIMTSTEWDALIKPSLKSKEDWVHGMVAATNALGWGRWQVTDVNEKEATFVIHDDYESVGHLAMYGTTDHDVAYLARGGVMGLMDLVYVGDVASKPDFTPKFYDRLFKSPDSYRAEVVESKVKGDEVTRIRVYRA